MFLRKTGLLFFVILCLFSGCSTPEISLKYPVPGDEVVLPPCREGQTVYKTAWADYDTVETAAAEADAVAVVTVGSWMGENTEDGQTAYIATVEKVYKGDLPETFLLLQSGTSEAYYYGSPLFTNGNELLVFLQSRTFEDYADVYGCMGVLTTFYVGRDDSGEAYIFGNKGTMSESLKGLENHGVAYDAETVWQIRRNFLEIDPYWEDKLSLFDVYKLSDVEEFLR